MKVFDDVAFLKNPNKWPNLVCPVKKRVENDNWPKCGVVFKEPIVYVVSMYSMKDVSDEEWDKLEKHEYNSFEEMVADGWIVD